MYCGQRWLNGGLVYVDFLKQKPLCLVISATGSVNFSCIFMRSA